MLFLAEALEGQFLLSAHGNTGVSVSAAKQNTVHEPRLNVVKMPFLNMTLYNSVIKLIHYPGSSEDPV